jgi:cell fate regulator YaaT (PSP1 superfamily)
LRESESLVPDIVGVRFKRAGRIYYFDPAGLDLKIDDFVVVETSRGTEVGRVVIAPKQVQESEIGEPLKPVIRRAESQDLHQQQFYKAREREALEKCEQRVAHYHLPMKLVGAEYNCDGSRLTFFFTAEGRVDFRELVKDLAGIFKTRIELRQIGVRDEAKIIGGLGRCGRQLCCSSFLGDFATVSIRMAKDQDLPLNPMKISGICGRLLCCLGYENEQYCALKQGLPRLGEEIAIPTGKGLVVGLNVLKETIMVELESKATLELSAEQVRLAAEKATTPPKTKLSSGRGAVPAAIAGHGPKTPRS